MYPIPHFLQHLQATPLSASSRIQLYHKIQHHATLLLEHHRVEFKQITVQYDTLNIYTDTEPIRIHLSIRRKYQIPELPPGFKVGFNQEYHLQFCTLLTKNATFQIKERM